jgi:hypothetical protein
VRITIDLVGGLRELAPEHRRRPVWSEPLSEFHVGFTPGDAHNRRSRSARSWTRTGQSDPHPRVLSQRVSQIRHTSRPKGANWMGTSSSVR